MELKMEGLPEFANKVKDTYDYLTGKRTHNLSGLNDATEEEIKTCPELDEFVRSFNSANGEIDVQVDSSGKRFLVTFSATSVPKTVADRIKPGGDYYNMISHYDKNSKTVEMIFSINKKESVMAPTPTPYELKLKTEDVEDEDPGYTLVDRKYVNDSDGFRTEYSWYMDFDGNSVFILGDSDFYTPEDGYFDHEEEDPEVAQEWFDSYNGFEDEEEISEDDLFERLIETAGLDTSTLVRKINEDGVDSIEMDINGRIYSFVMKEESPYTIDQMFHKVTKMRHYSEGRALQFLKKNMIGKRVESFLREGSVDLTDDIRRAIDAIYERKDKYKSQDEMIDAMYSAISDFLREYQFISRSKGEVVEDILQKNLDRLGIDSDLEEGKNPFKDKHICNGCGKSLSQCTCDVQEEEDVEESLTEAVTTETYKTIKIELNDPDSQLENLIKCIKASSDPGHTFSVTVDGDESKVFTIDGEGSFRISSIEVKDEVEDVEIDESLTERLDFTECEVHFFNPKTNEQDTMIVTASDEMDAIDVSYERIFSEFGMTRDEYDEECGPINQVDVRPMYTNESLVESSTFAGDAYLEPGTLVDFGLYGSLYVVKDNGDSWIVSYNKDGSGKTWSMKKYLGQGVIEDPLVAQKNDPDAPYEVLSISVNDDGVVEAQCVDFIDGTDFEKTIGDPKSSEGKNNAHKLLRDYSYYIDNKLRDEIVSTFGLKEDIGSGATQPSSVGQFKKGSLDMFPDSDK